MLSKKLFKSPENKKITWKLNPLKLSSIALALSLLLSQPSTAENLSHNPPKVEKQVKQININWIQEGIKTTEDIKKINEIFENWNKLSFQQRMLVFNSLIKQYKLIKQKIKEKSNENNFHTNFVNHLKKSKVDAAVYQAIWKIFWILPNKNKKIDWKNINEIQEEIEIYKHSYFKEIFKFVYYFKNLNKISEINEFPFYYDEDYPEENFLFYKIIIYWIEWNIISTENNIILSLLQNLLSENDFSKFFNEENVYTYKKSINCQTIILCYNPLSASDPNRKKLNETFKKDFITKMSNIAETLDQLIRTNSIEKLYKDSINNLF